MGLSSKGFSWELIGICYLAFGAGFDEHDRACLQLNGHGTVSALAFKVRKDRVETSKKLLASHGLTS
jgi:hypothetical protein